MDAFFDGSNVCTHTRNVPVGPYYIILSNASHRRIRPAGTPRSADNQGLAQNEGIREGRTRGEPRHPDSNKPVGWPWYSERLPRQGFATQQASSTPMDKPQCS